MFLYHPSYSQLALPEKHRFPIKKYQQIHEFLLETRHSTQLITADSPIATPQLALCHESDYIHRFISGTLSNKEIKKMGFPWSEQLVQRTLMSVGASLQAAKLALRTGVAANLSGGYHHAHANFGSGFCIFNDFAVVAASLIEAQLADRVLIFDCDVHQGDGTASILHNRDDIITCSVHCEQNFPRNKPLSNFDFSLPAGSKDKLYLETVSEALHLCVRLHQPDIVLYNAGADICEEDELGLLSVSLAGVKQRDHLVFSHCFEQQIPLCFALGGGYQRDINKLVCVHKQTFFALFDNLPILV
ncbi:histone deacetylase family protein [Pseudoalteromonas sp. T1lg65]|uniref:histone deacetylase family protein n=1 Tax=Pseudoalteromonas sp. T1lg65 TaxID=2077101 RepID=UPI003F7B037F